MRKKKPFSLNPWDVEVIISFRSFVALFEGWFFEVPACAETLVSALLKQASPGQQLPRQNMRHIIFRVNEPSLSWKKNSVNLQSQSPWKGFTSIKKNKDFHFTKGGKKPTFSWSVLYLALDLSEPQLAWELLRWERNLSLCWYHVTISICAYENKSQSATSRCNTR